VPGVAGDLLRGDRQQLVLVGHLRRAGGLGDGCAPGGHGEHARGQPVQAPVMGVPVQQQVRRLVPAEPAVQVVGVAQVLVVQGRPAHDVVVHGGTLMVNPGHAVLGV
jgi:hypothetical protein